MSQTAAQRSPPAAAASADGECGGRACTRTHYAACNPQFAACTRSRKMCCGPNPWVTRHRLKIHKLSAPTSLPRRMRSVANRCDSAYRGSSFQHQRLFALGRAANFGVASSTTGVAVTSLRPTCRRSDLADRISSCKIKSRVAESLSKRWASSLRERVTELKSTFDTHDACLTGADAGNPSSVHNTESILVRTRLAQNTQQLNSS